jgi:tetratricopeptide (TPR) repeat protein
LQRSIFLFLAVFNFSVILKAQDPEKYNAVYNRVYVEISQKDFNRALEIADSLYSVSETDLFKAKSLMLSASLYEQAGDLKKAIDYAKRADKALEKSNEYVWKTRVLGFLASQHRSLSLYNESEKYVNRAIETAKKIDDPKRADVTLGLLEQEKAMGKSESGDYREAIIHFDKAAEYFEKSEAETLLIAQNHQFKGQAFLGLDEYDNAIPEFQKVLDLWGDIPDNYIKGMSYVGLSQAYSKTDRPELAKENLDLADKTLKGSEYLEVLKALWDAKVEYYQAANEVSLLKTAYAKRDSIINEIKKQKDIFLDYSFNELSQENLKNYENQKIKNYALVVGSLVILAGLAFII